MSCKTFIEDADGVIWSQPLCVVKARLDECLQLHAEYRDQCRKLRAHLGDTREFSEVIMCGKFDKFADRLRKIIDMFTVLHKYRALRDSKIEGDLCADFSHNNIKPVSMDVQLDDIVCQLWVLH